MGRSQWGGHKMAAIGKSDNEMWCFFCGKTADAYWQGAWDKIAVCTRCAVETMPHLIADSGVGNNVRHETPNDAKQAVRQIEKNYYRGCFLATVRARRAGENSRHVKPKVRERKMAMASEEQKQRIYRAIDTLHPGGDTVFELCAIGPRLPGSKAWEGRAGGKKGIVAGWFKDRVMAAQAAAEVDSIGAEGIYITLNPCSGSLLARANGRLKAGVDRTQDKEILCLNWLPIDIDPQRPAGISSSGREHDLALERASWLKKTLAGCGWPDPLMADSGNGAHLCFRLPGLGKHP